MLRLTLARSVLLRFLCDRTCCTRYPAEDAYMDGKTIVVLAGYETDMQDMMALNPGLKSRFTEYIDFPGGVKVTPLLAGHWWLLIVWWEGIGGCHRKCRGSDRCVYSTLTALSAF
jgi:hypothetical protein